MMNSCQTFKQIEAFARSKGLPLIPINAADIAIIDEPKTFFETILSQIKMSQRRCCLSSLYLGVNEKEQKLVNQLKSQLNKEKNLQVKIALDANRARRKDSNDRSSVCILKKLDGYGRRVSFNLIETRKKNFFNGLIGRLQRWNEVVSTYHAKFFVFDDNVILTGANLSSVYFDVRRDRYLLLNKSPILAHYLSDLIQSMDGQLSEIKDRIDRVNKKFVRHEVQQCHSNTYAMPLIQFGPMGITDKEDFVIFLDTIKPKEGEFYLSSGYFNPSPKMSSITMSSALVASEGANNFGSGPGLMKYVPKLYTSLYKDYFDTHKDCGLNLYQKKDWSFHAKGLWLENLDDIYIHIIGSSNYNHRSAFRDLENQVVIITKDEKLISKLQLERQSLWLDSILASKEQFNELNLLHKGLARLFRSYL